MDDCECYVACLTAWILYYRLLRVKAETYRGIMLAPHHRLAGMDDFWEEENNKRSGEQRRNSIASESILVYLTFT